MFDRTDPYFRTQAPHRNGYIESLHRQYGEPKGALPGRKDVTFQRALRFREEEKQRYKAMEDRNAVLERQYGDLKDETDKIRSLFEQLSKADVKLNNERLAARHDPDPTAGVRPGAGDANDDGAGVGVDSAAPDAPSGGAGDPRDAEAPAGETRERGQVPGEVLPGDLRGHAAQHEDEGPELRGGAGDPEKTDGEE